MDSYGKWLEHFKYTETITNYNNYNGVVDEHIMHRHDCGTNYGLNLEETWETTRWDIRVFTFITVVCEVNAYLVMKLFGDLKMTQLEFQKN